jgi:hypothetical protein
MKLERVEWLLGTPGAELPETALPRVSSGKALISGERFFRWQTDRNTFLDGTLLIGFDGGVVRDISYSETPLF